MAPFYVCQIFSVSNTDGEGPGSLDQESSQMKTLQYRQRVRRYHNGQHTPSWRCFYKDFQTWDYFPQLLNYQISRVSGYRLKAFHCTTPVKT